MTPRERERIEAEAERVVDAHRRSGAWRPLPDATLEALGRLFGGAFVRRQPTAPTCGDCGDTLAPGPEGRWVGQRATCPGHPVGHAWEGSPWVP